jgi:hypothetical protein
METDPRLQWYIEICEIWMWKNQGEREREPTMHNYKKEKGQMKKKQWKGWGVELNERTNWHKPNNSESLLLHPSSLEIERSHIQNLFYHSLLQNDCGHICLPFS